MGGNLFFDFGFLNAGSTSTFSSLAFELVVDKVDVEPKPPYPVERTCAYFFGCRILGLFS